MKKDLATYPIEKHIYCIRDQRVMIDFDLADIYGVSTKAFNQAVKRNSRRFPSDFMFRLTPKELKKWRSQFVTSNSLHRMGLRRPPYAFTEHGAIMAANVLKSIHAEKMSVYVVRAFVRMRSVISKHEDLVAQLVSLERKLSGRLDSHERAIIDVVRRVLKLLEPPKPVPIRRRKRIGFGR